MLFCRWLTILYTTLAARLLTLPLVVKQHKGMARMSVSADTRPTPPHSAALMLLSGLPSSKDLLQAMYHIL